YDAEEFWFRDGHLLLRGNNGTGKSKVLSLTLPFLLDASLRSERVEPDGDRGKRMEWNLLMGGAAGERRTGYTWIEFGRRDTSGAAQYLTLGCGLRGVAGKPVEPWYFLTTQRIGETLWLTTPERTALSRDRLQAAIGHHGQLFDSAQAYRRAVDEQLFRLGETRYAALIDTLIQLRQPQLSKQPDETRLSRALSEALPPLDRGLLEDVAESFNRLDDLKRELEELDAMYKAVAAFEKRYQSYAQVAARRRAAEVRRAMSRFEDASREVNEAEVQATAATAEVEQLQALDRELALAIAEDEARLQALGEDPAHLDAARLDEARRDAEQAEDWQQQAQRRAGEARSQHERELRQLHERRRQAEGSRERLVGELQLARELAAATGVGAALEQALAGATLPDGADALGAELPDQLRRSADESAQARLRQIELLRKRLRELADAQRAQAACASERRARADDYDQAAATVELRQREQRAAADALLQAAQRHLQSLRHLVLDAGPLLAALEDWIDSGAGDNPLRRALQQARSERERLLADEEAQARQQQQALDAERAALEAEAAALTSGQPRAPPAPYTRGADVRRDRAGAPLWQLIDFAAGLEASQRAGLEAALEASGLLDAWVTPDGALLDAATHDVQLLAAAPVAGETLQRWLRADIPEPNGAGTVAAAVVDALLASIAAGETDPGSGQAWVSPQGRFRLGPAHGAWAKPQAELIGNTAREAARRRRLAEIVQHLDALAEQAQALAARLEALALTREAMRAECDAAPADEPLLRAQLAYAEAERQRRLLQERLAVAEAKLAAAGIAVERARDALEIDATDLGLPADRSALDALSAQLHDYRRSAAALAASVREHRRDRLELAAQHEREQRAQAAVVQARGEADQQTRAAHQARTRFETLRAAVGERVDALQARIGEARTTLQRHRDEREIAREQQIGAYGRRTAAEEKERNARLRLAERSEARSRAIGVLQSFAATGLLQQALPALELPPLDTAWGVDAARTLARRAEQALGEVPAEDADWQRVQSHISADLTELQRAMSAQGHEAVSEVADDCMLVHIVYRSRAQAPDRLRAQVEAERAERRMQLTANEREILENHLQQEIAAGLQRLIQDTERRVAAINAELERRPTSTGVRYRLAWLPAESEDAPAGLAEARSRLLRTRAEAWSAEDRRVVGEFLSRRIETERERDDQAVQLDVLSAALDYRRWHRFAVQRKLSKADPNWRPLSGPASSGEKALGLTVPLFAAASSFYESADPRAPRLVLLDEAFAGIDDDARRHCMALIREFDLDFVMTSEREWGCYAELPAVAISQLVRREDADAVFVSRWNWDGRERRAELDPERRFPEAAPAT
ncbi:MAG: TIGR02680 family protein, partial [Pseudomonadota bacterium]